LAVEHVYRDGKLLDDKNKPYNGVYRYYYPNGKIREEITYKDGRPLGPWRGFYQNGALEYEYITTKENRYESGKAYYADARIQSSIENINGVTVVKRYDRKGDLIH
jgi:antitoxin component YwqK of YwqJK toxin-antitoxin module